MGSKKKVERYKTLEQFIEDFDRFALAPNDDTLKEFICNKLDKTDGLVKVDIANFLLKNSMISAKLVSINYKDMNLKWSVRSNPWMNNKND